MKFLKKIPLILIAIAITSCATTKTAQQSSYDIESKTVSIKSETRGVEIPGTLVTPVGEGVFPVVVIAHGHGGNREENGGLTNIAETLGKNGIASIRIDFPGCGESSEGFELNTVSNMIDDVNSALTYVTSLDSINSEKIGIFGYSMGGRIAVKMIGDDPEKFTGAVLLAPAADDFTMINFLGGQEAWDNYYKEADENGSAAFTTIYGQTQKLSKEFFEDLTETGLIEKAKAFKGKSLVIYGEDDNVVSSEVSKSVAEALGGKSLDVTGDTHSYSFYSDKPEIRKSIVDGTVNLFVEALK
ncbi:MAG: alpha/beta fold hydrolase [Spirochaetales bacterium]|nr:alpha/beta fold hydrolase [Spirochaetales bacterium]